MQIQYYRTVEWDPELQDVGTEETGLAVSGQKLTPGMPAATPKVFIPGAIIQNISAADNGDIWYNSGTTDNPIWTLLSGGAGSGATWTPQGPTTSDDVGGVDTGTDLGTVPVTIESTLLSIFYPYAAPRFTSFSITGQSQTLEVGTTISGTKSFAWTFANASNIEPDTMDIIDVTAGVNLETDIPITSPFSTDVGTVQLTAPGSYSWRGEADNTNLVTFQSSLFTVNWRWRLYYGTSASTTLNEAAIESLASSTLAVSEGGTYSFAAGNYKYFAWPDDFGSPTASTGFKDTATSLAVSMATNLDDAFYGNVENGWYYGLVTVTNVEGIATDYRVYRTKNTLGSTINILVS